MTILEHVPNYIRTLVPYEPGKPLEEVEREYGISNSIKLASNENPLGPSPKALQAIQDKAAQLHLYPDGDCFYLKHALSKKLAVEPEEIIFGNGSNEIIELAARTFVRPGDEVVMARQSFVVYRLIVQAIGGVAKEVELRDFTHDLAAMSRAITSRTRLIFLGNPNNPTGTIYRRGEWERFFQELSPEILVVVDEAYFEYVDVRDYPDSLQYRGRGKALLTLRTFSKLYGLAGLRIGYGVGPREIVAVMHRIRQPFNINAAAQWGALAALDDRDHVRRTLDVNREGKAYLEKQLERLGVQYVPSHANFILLQVRDGETVFKELLAKGVIVRPMGIYAFPEYVRVTIGTMEDNRRFIECLESILRAGFRPKVASLL